MRFRRKKKTNAQPALININRAIPIPSGVSRPKDFKDLTKEELLQLKVLPAPPSVSDERRQIARLIRDSRLNR